MIETHHRPYDYFWNSIKCLLNIHQTHAQLFLLRPIYLLHSSHYEQCVCRSSSRHKTKLHWTFTNSSTRINRKIPQGFPLEIPSLRTTVYVIARILCRQSCPITLSSAIFGRSLRGRRKMCTFNAAPKARRMWLRRSSFTTAGFTTVVYPRRSWRESRHLGLHGLHGHNVSISNTSLANKKKLQRSRESRDAYLAV